MISAARSRIIAKIAARLVHLEARAAFHRSRRLIEFASSALITTISALFISMMATVLLVRAESAAMGRW